jgi:hypothetical protein
MNPITMCLSKIKVEHTSLDGSILSLSRVYIMSCKHVEEYIRNSRIRLSFRMLHIQVLMKMTKIFLIASLLSEMEWIFEKNWFQSHALHACQACPFSISFQEISCRCQCLYEVRVKLLEQITFTKVLCESRIILRFMVSSQDHNWYVLFDALSQGPEKIKSNSSHESVMLAELAISLKVVCYDMGQGMSLQTWHYSRHTRSSSDTVMCIA